MVLLSVNSHVVMRLQASSDKLNPHVTAVPIPTIKRCGALELGLFAAFYLLDIAVIGICLCGMVSRKICHCKVSESNEDRYC
jgi:hypothetical protein